MTRSGVHLGIVFRIGKLLDLPHYANSHFCGIHYLLRKILVKDLPGLV